MMGPWYPRPNMQRQSEHLRLLKVGDPESALVIGSYILLAHSKLLQCGLGVAPFGYSLTSESLEI